MFDVSRILAIPDFDDMPQMGLSKAGLAAIVERGGITKDGTKAKASVLERAGIKGDRKLDEAKPRIKFEDNPSIAVTYNKKGDLNVGSAAKKIKTAIAKTKANRGSTWADSGIGKGNESWQKKSESQMSLSEFTDYYKKSGRWDKDIQNAEKSRDRANKQVANRLNYKNAGYFVGRNERSSKSLESQALKAQDNYIKVLDGDHIAGLHKVAVKQPNSSDAEKNRYKVIKGQKPVSGRVIESGKTGKDGFTKATVSIPLHSRNSRSGVMLGEPMKGEKIGDYHVSGDSRSGYSVTHIPSGFSVLNSSILEGELGGNDKETAKLAAKKLHEAKIPLPKTFHKMKNSKQPKIQELGRKVLSAIK